MIEDAFFIFSVHKPRELDVVVVAIVVERDVTIITISRINFYSVRALWIKKTTTTTTMLMITLSALAPINHIVKARRRNALIRTPTSSHNTLTHTDTSVSKINYYNRAGG